jgi:hypothetical protein
VAVRARGEMHENAGNEIGKRKEKSSMYLLARETRHVDVLAKCDGCNQA